MATPTTTTLTVNPTSGVAFENYTLTASVSPAPTTGTIIFDIDGVSNFRTLTNGVAVLVTQLSSSVQIVAIYEGTSEFGPSTSVPVNVTVSPGTVTGVTNIGATVPVQVAETITLTLSAVPPSQPTNLDGIVDLLVDGTLVGESTVTDNIATFTYTFPTIGSYQLEFIYSNSLYFNEATFFHDVEAVGTATQTIVTVTPEPSAINESTTITASISSMGTITMDGSVVFAVNGTTIATVAVTGAGGSGTASTTYTFTTAGNYTVTANYEDSVYYADSTGMTSHNVGLAATVTSLSSNLNPATVGTSVTFTSTTTGGVNPTGTVTFYIDGVAVYTTPDEDIGMVSYTTADLTIGSHSVYTIYSGDSTNGTSTSNIIDQVIDGYPSTTTITSETNPSTVGETVTFDITVTGSTPPGTIPTGTGNFLVDGVVVDMFTLSPAGNASVTYTFFAQTDYSVAADYLGDTNYNASGGSLDQVVGQSTVTVSLMLSPNPSVSGQTVTVTAYIISATPSVVPTGTVNFNLNDVTVATEPVTNGMAVYTTSTLPVGTTNVVAVYSGDSNYIETSSPQMTQTVTSSAPASTMTTLTSSENPSVYSQLVTFTATITSATSGDITGTADFYDGTTLLGSETVTNGIATFSTSNLSIGTHSITAVYSGNSVFAGSTSNVVDQVVTMIPTTTQAVVGPNPSVYGQTVTLTALVTPVPPYGGTPTGTVTFQNGSTVVGTAPVIAGNASLLVDNLPVGLNTIIAIYSGDATFVGSTSFPVVEVVNKGNTNTSLTSSLNPSIYGQVVTFTATVSPVSPSTGTGTGTVTFFNNGVSIGTGTLSGGVATLSITTLPVGSNTITAVYGGDSNFIGSTSPNLIQVVSPPNASVNLTSSLNPSGYGQAVTFTASVTAIPPTTGTPTGTVLFFDGTTLIGSGTLSGGVTTFTTSILPVGNNDITAIYTGDTIFGSATSSTLVQVVMMASVTVSLTSSVNPSVYGQSVVFTVMVTPIPPATGTPTGTIELYDESGLIASSTLIDGMTTFTLDNLAVGSHPLTAVYLGDSTFSSTTSPLLSQVVTMASTSTTLETSPNPSTLGQSVTLTATVSPVSPSTGTPTGTVSFYNGTILIGTAPLISGVATLMISTLPMGANVLTAVYSGDTDYIESTSLPVIQVVGVSVTTTTLTSSPNPSWYGQNVTFTATVTPTAPGTVTFYVDGRAVATVVLIGGVAIYSTPTLAPGYHSVYAVYNGNTLFAPSTSNTVIQTVFFCCRSYQ